MRRAIAVLLVVTAPPALAEIVSPADPANTAAFDILTARVARAEGGLAFAMTVAGRAGSAIPAATGALAGAPVWSYVWPTSLDPATVGFEGGTGILALAATAHPDFDDTPRQDENGDGDSANDGAGWHSHWVVLTPNETCGPGALSVRDIPEGESPRLPDTWPGLPLFMDSPGFVPTLSANRIEVMVALPAGTDLSTFRFDGVTSALRVNASVHAPLLCVTDVWDVASGDLSLPGEAE